MPAERGRPSASDAANCAEVACRSRDDMFKAMKRVADKAPDAHAPPVECPPMREDLGRCSWTLMHTLAAHYPRTPSLYEQVHAANFFRAVAALYPCTHCRDDFHASVAEHPPRVESREALAVWLCEQHNVVNAKLGKPTFPCDFAALDRRWRTGRPGCFEEAGETSAESLGQDS